MKCVSRLVAAAALVAGFAGAATAQTIEELVAAADPEHGATVFNRCKACHTDVEGGPHRVGPNLWGIVGKDVASADGFNYSGALGDFGGVWTLERLNEFLADPRGTVPGTRMAFPGVPIEEDRYAVIAYLQAQSSEDE